MRLASAVRLRWSAARQRRRGRRLMREQTSSCWTTSTLRLIIYLLSGYICPAFSSNIALLHRVTRPPPRLISETGTACCSRRAEAGVPIAADRGQWRCDHREPADVFLTACGHYFPRLHHSRLPSCRLFSQGSKARCLNKPRVTNDTSRVQLTLDSLFLFPLRN